jgi:hypothetical protein
VLLGAEVLHDSRNEGGPGAPFPKDFPNSPLSRDDVAHICGSIDRSLRTPTEILSAIYAQFDPVISAVIALRSSFH